MIRTILCALLVAAIVLPGCSKKPDELSESEEIKNLWTPADKKINEVLTQAQHVKESGQPGEAVKLYQVALQTYNTTAAGQYSFNWGLWAQMCIGEAFEADKKFDKAIEAYRIIADRFVGGGQDDSWAIEAHKKIVTCFRAMKKEKQARAELQKIIEADQRVIQTSPSDPSVAWAALEIGWCYGQMKDWKKAVDAYEKAKQNYPQGSWAGQADLGIADCYDKQGDRKKSREILNRIVEQYPRDWAEQAKRRLAEMDGKPAAAGAAKPAGAKANTAPPLPGGARKR